MVPLPPCHHPLPKSQEHFPAPPADRTAEGQADHSVLYKAGLVGAVRDAQPSLVLTHILEGS